MKPLYLQVFYTFKIHSCQAILIILLYVLLNSDPLSGDILGFWQCSPKKLQFISKLCGWTKMYLLWIRGNLLIYCFGTLIHWQSLLALNFQWPIIACSVSLALEVLGLQLRMQESSWMYRVLEPLPGFYLGSELEHCPFLATEWSPMLWGACPGKKSLQWVLQQNCSVLETDGSSEHAREVLCCSPNLFAGGILLTEIREFQKYLDWKGP